MCTLYSRLSTHLVIFHYICSLFLLLYLPFFFFFFIKHLLLLFFLLFLWTEIRSNHYVQMHVKGDYDLFSNFYITFMYFWLFTIIKYNKKMKLIVFPFLIKNLNLFAVQIVLCDVLCISWINDTRDHLLECIYFVCFPFCIYFVYSPFSFVYFFVTIRWRVEKK